MHVHMYVCMYECMCVRGGTRSTRAAYLIVLEVAFPYNVLHGDVSVRQAGHCKRAWEHPSHQWGLTVLPDCLHLLEIQAQHAAVHREGKKIHDEY